MLDTPSLNGSQLNDTYIFDKLNNSTMSKTNLSHNIDGATEFLSAVSFEDRIKLVT